MLEILSLAIFYTLILVISVGPITFTLFDVSIRKGFKAVLLFIIGVYCSDLLFISLIQFGFEKYLKNYFQSKDTIFYAGLLLITFGIIQVIKTFKNKTQLLETKNNEFAKQFVKGFTINSLAPGVLAFWILLSGVVHSQKLFKNWYDALIFFGTILTLNFGFDILKALMAKKLKTIMNTRVQKILQYSVGIIFIVFGIGIVVQTFL